MDAGRDPPAADGQERQPRALGAGQLEQPPEEDPALRPARRVGEEAGRSPLLLVQVDERVEIGERVADVLQADLTDRLGPADLAPDLVALLLAERREVVVHRGADRQVDDRADVLALHVERPALGDLARPERRRPGRRPRDHRSAAGGGRSRPRVGRPRVVREMVDERGGDRREVRRRAQDRGVVGVVRGPEEDRGRGRLDRRELGARLVAHRRVGQRVARLDLVAVHERDDRDRLAAGPVGADDERLLVGVVAVRVPPGALEGPAGERAWPTASGRRCRSQASRPMSRTFRRSVWRGPVVEWLGAAFRVWPGPDTGAPRASRRGSRSKC